MIVLMVEAKENLAHILKEFDSASERTRFKISVDKSNLLVRNDRRAYTEKAKISLDGSE